MIIDNVVSLANIEQVLATATLPVHSMCKDFPDMGLMSFVNTVLFRSNKCVMEFVEFTFINTAFGMVLLLNTGAAVVLQDVASTNHFQKMWSANDECQHVFLLAPQLLCGNNGHSNRNPRELFENTVMLALQMCTTSACNRIQYSCYYLDTTSTNATANNDHSHKRELCPVYSMIPGDVIDSTPYFNVVLNQNFNNPVMKPTVPVVSEFGIPVSMVQLDSCKSAAPFFIELNSKALDVVTMSVKPVVWEALYQLQNKLQRQFISDPDHQSIIKEELFDAQQDHDLMISYLKHQYDLLDNVDLHQLKNNIINDVVNWNLPGHTMTVCSRAFCISHMFRIIEMLLSSTSDRVEDVKRLRNDHFNSRLTRRKLTATACFNTLVCDMSTDDIPDQWKPETVHDTPEKGFVNLLMVALWHETIHIVLKAMKKVANLEVKHYESGVLFTKDSRRGACRINNEGVVYLFFNPLVLNIGSIATTQRNAETAIEASLQSTTYNAHQRDLCMSYFINLATSLLAEVLTPRTVTDTIICTLTYIRGNSEITLREKFTQQQRDLRNVRQYLKRKRKALKTSKYIECEHFKEKPLQSITSPFMRMVLVPKAMQLTPLSSEEDALVLPIAASELSISKSESTFKEPQQPARKRRAMSSSSVSSEELEVERKAPFSHMDPGEVPIPLSLPLPIPLSLADLPPMAPAGATTATGEELITDQQLYDYLNNSPPTSPISAPSLFMD